MGTLIVVGGYPQVHMIVIPMEGVRPVGDSCTMTLVYS